MADGPNHPPSPIHPLADSSTIPYRVGLLETAAVSHGNRLDALEDRFLRLDGAFALLRFTLGTSIVSAVIAIISIVLLLSGADAVNVEWTWTEAITFWIVCIAAGVIAGLLWVSL